MAATFDSGTSDSHIYVDGVDVTLSTTTQTMTANDSPLLIGARPSPSPTYPKHFVRGIIDEMRIWNVAFTAAQTAIAAEDTAMKMKILHNNEMVIFTSVFHGLSIDNTVTIHLLADLGITITSGTVNRVTPKGTADVAWSSNTGTSIDVTITSVNGRVKTIHLWLYLNTGEHIGVNLQLAR